MSGVGKLVERVFRGRDECFSCDWWSWVPSWSEFCSGGLAGVYGELFVGLDGYARLVCRSPFGLAFGLAAVT